MYVNWLRNKYANDCAVASKKSKTTNLTCCLFRSDIWRMNSKTLFLHLALIYQVSYVMVYFIQPQRSNPIQKYVSYATGRMRQKKIQFRHAKATFSITCWNRYVSRYLALKLIFVPWRRRKIINNNSNRKWHARNTCSEKCRGLKLSEKIRPVINLSLAYLNKNSLFFFDQQYKSNLFDFT